MFDQILGKFLVETKRITQEQLEEAITAQDTIHVKLGVTAVSEKLMTLEQAEEVNALQAAMDMRFGDIAVLKHYLTSDQVKRLLGQQGNEYLIFIQTLIDKNIMDMEQIGSAVEDFQKANGFMESEMILLKSGDIDHIVPIFLAMEEPLYRQFFGIAARTIYRIVDNHMSIGRAFKAVEVKAEVTGYQRIMGDHRVFTAFTGDQEAIKKAASAYTKDVSIESMEDALDAICELLNCINGMFATELSKTRIDIDMAPPIYGEPYTVVRGEELHVLPITICGELLHCIVGIDRAVSVE